MDPLQYPVANRDKLTELYVGKHLNDLPTPAAVLDKAVVEQNCAQMRSACERLNVTFRAHVKTHKTAEVTRLQVGSTGHVKVIVSTIAEAEHLQPYLLECLLYGIPLPPSSIPRLVSLGKCLGRGSISVLIDNPQHLPLLKTFKETAGFGPDVYIKIDTGYHRAGIPPLSPVLTTLISTISSDFEPSGICHLRGFYSHAGHSYGNSSPLASASHLLTELTTLSEAADLASKIISSSHDKFTLSVGATPTATTLEHLSPSSPSSSTPSPDLQTLHSTLSHLTSLHTIELHAGVYPILDLQQLAAQSKPQITHSCLALTILTEVNSTYPSRQPAEALIAAGTLALGREPCKSYDGWGVVSSWSESAASNSSSNADGNEVHHPSGWYVAKISQEHGVLRREDANTAALGKELHVGQKLRVWPNHACVAGAGFGWYFVVDSKADDGGNRVVDVWVRGRGW
ncbi:hypothetical protein MMC20_000857 [Loxospora ochrophaea]|nr:hypothetical protein [Loxospora ochrophaea]